MHDKTIEKLMRELRALVEERPGLPQPQGLCHPTEDLELKMPDDLVRELRAAAPKRSSMMKSKQCRIRCTCDSCERKLGGWIRRSIRGSAAVEAVALREQTPPSDSQKQLFETARTVLETVDYPYLQGARSLIKGRAVPYIPGMLFIGAVTKEGEIIDVRSDCVEFWDYSKEDLGAKKIIDCINALNESVAVLSSPEFDDVARIPKFESDFEQRVADFSRGSLVQAHRYNVAIWTPGLIEVEAPVHFFCVSPDCPEGIGIMDEGGPRSVVPHAIFKASMAEQLGRAAKKFEEVYGRFDGEMGETIFFDATVDRLAKAMFYGFSEVSQLININREIVRVVGAIHEMHSLESQRVVDEAIQRRKAAVAAKNEQLRVAKQSVAKLQADLAKKIDECRSLQSKLLKLQSPAASTAAASAATPEATPPIPQLAQPQVDLVDEVDEVDESELHWQELAEHQAEVLRQMRIALASARTGGQSTPDFKDSQSGEDESQRGAPAGALEKPNYTLATLADWAADNADRAVVLKRAISAGKKSKLDDERIVFEALDIIAGVYRDVKLGLADRMAFKDACVKAGLDFGGSVSEEVNDLYFFRWNGRRVFLDQHVGRGNSRDPRFCMRIYFTWIEEDAKVVIGWLPSHLPTKNS